jgi:hypothetical protein
MVTSRKRVDPNSLGNVYREKTIRNYLNLKQIATRPNSLTILMKPSRIGNILFYPKEIDHV